MAAIRILAIADAKMLPALASGLRVGGRFEVTTAAFADVAELASVAAGVDVVAFFYGSRQWPLVAGLRTLAPAVLKRGGRVVAVLQKEQALLRDDCFAAGACDAIFMPLPKEAFVARLFDAATSAFAPGVSRAAAVIVVGSSPALELGDAKVSIQGIEARAAALSADERIRVSWTDGRSFTRWSLVVQSDAGGVRLRFVGATPDEDAQLHDWVQQPVEAAIRSAEASAPTRIELKAVEEPPSIPATIVDVPSFPATIAEVAAVDPPAAAVAPVSSTILVQPPAPSGLDSLFDDVPRPSSETIEAIVAPVQLTDSKVVALPPPAVASQVDTEAPTSKRSLVTNASAQRGKSASRMKWVALALCGAVAVATIAYAFGFSSLRTRAASPALLAQAGSGVAAISLSRATAVVTVSPDWIDAPGRPARLARLCVVLASASIKQASLGLDGRAPNAQLEVPSCLAIGLPAEAPLPVVAPTAPPPPPVVVLPPAVERPSAHQGHKPRAK